MVWRFRVLILGLVMLVPMELHANESPHSVDDQITEIEIIGTRNAREEEIVRALMGLSEGGTLLPQQVRQGIKRVMARGFYRNVEVYYKSQNGSQKKTLQVRLSPSAYLENFIIEGMNNEESTLIKKRLGIRNGEPVSEKFLERIQIQAGHILKELGFASAKIKLTWDQQDRIGWVMRMVVEKGARQVISSIEFKGTLFEQRHTLMGIIDVLPGAPLVQAKIQRGRDYLLKSMWAKGYLAGDISTEIQTDESHTKVVFLIEKGPMYQLYFHGEKAFTAGFLRQNVIALSEIEGVGENSLKRIRRKVIEFYKRQGFWFADLQIKDVPAIGEWAQKTDRLLWLSIDAGDQAYVENVKIRGAVAKQHQELTRSLWQIFRESNEKDKLQDHFRPEQFQGTLNGDARNLSSDATKVFDDQTILTPRGLKDARIFLEKLYRKEGFLFVQIDRPDVKHDRQRSNAEVVFHIQEGQQMRVGSVSVRPSPPFALGAFLRQTQLIPDQPLNYFAVEETRLRLLRLFEENGYPWVKVVERLTPVPNQQVLDVFFDVSPGPYVTIGDIQIQGAKVTQVQVIRERLLMTKGTAFKRSEVEASRMNLLQLGVFSQVNIELDDIERGPSMRDIHVKVEERPQVTLEAGVGASLEDGPRTFTSFTYRNIAGKGLALKGRFQVNYPALFFPLGFLYSPERIDTLLQRFSEQELRNPLALSEGQAIVAMSYPRIPGWLWNTGAHVDWNTVRDIRWAFTMNRTSLVMGLFTNPAQGFHLRPQGEMEFTYFDCAVEGRELGQSCGEESIGLTQKQESGTIALGTLRLMSVWDQRDDPFQPHKGWMFSTTFESTSGNGILDSGDVVSDISSPVAVRSLYGKVTSAVSLFLPLAPGVTLAQNVKGGWIQNFDDQGYVPLFKRFFLGGTKTIRGFNEDQVLPVDDEEWPAWEKDPARTELLGANKTSLGGQVYWVSRTEFRFPLSQRFEGGMFLDMGALALDPVNLSPEWTSAGMGMGIRFQTPIGPFVVDLATPLIDGRRRLGFDPSQSFRLHFAIGYF